MVKVNPDYLTVSCVCTAFSIPKITVEYPAKANITIITTL